MAWVQSALQPVVDSRLVGEVIDVELGAGDDRNVEYVVAVGLVGHGDGVGALLVEPDGVQDALAHATVVIVGAGQVYAVIVVDDVQVGVSEREVLGMGCSQSASLSPRTSNWVAVTLGELGAILN